MTCASSEKRADIHDPPVFSRSFIWQTRTRVLKVPWLIRGIYTHGRNLERVLSCLGEDGKGSSISSSRSSLISLDLQSACLSQVGPCLQSRLAVLNDHIVENNMAKIDPTQGFNWKFGQMANDLLTRQHTLSRPFKLCPSLAPVNTVGRGGCQLPGMPGHHRCSNPGKLNFRKVSTFADPN